MPRRLRVFFEGVGQDVRYGARTLGRQPAFAITAVLTLALAVAANAVIFSVVNSALVRPLPYAEPDRLVQFHFTAPSINHEQPWMTDRDAVDFEEQSHSFKGVGIYRYSLLNFGGGDLPEAVYGLRASAELLPLLGVPPALGRFFTAEEDQPGHAHVIILSDDLWRRRFGADPAVIGSSVELSDERYTIIGVMPPGFNFPLKMPTTVRLPSQQMGYWHPLALAASQLSRLSAGCGAIARLKAGVTIEQAQADVGQIAERLSRDYPQTNADRGVRLVTLDDQFFGDVRPTLLILLGAVGLVMLLACANVANLLLVRADGRRREMAIRQSLGASRRRLIRQIVTESLLLALLGGAAGTLLAEWALPLLLRLSPQAVPRLVEARIDGGVLGFVLTVSLLAGLLCAVAPAWRAARSRLNEDLKQNATTSSGKRGAAGRALIVAEVALALILTLGAGLLLNSFVRLIKTDLGFRADEVMAAVVVPTATRYRDLESKLEFYRRMVESVRTIPGVEFAAASDTLPYSGQSGGDQVRIEGRPPVATLDSRLQPEMSTVTADFIQTMGIAPLRGRLFNEHDTLDSSPVVVISEAAAQEFWPGEDALGKRMSIGLPDGHPVWRQVIGIVQDTHNVGLDQPSRPHVYLPITQYQVPPNFLLVRSTRPHADVVRAVREAVAAADKDQAVFVMASLEDWVSDWLARRRFALLLLGLFGALALLLAGVGVYGVVAYAAAQRTREMGIRMALGASTGAVVRLVVRQGMKPALLGVMIGLAGAAALTRLLRSLLFGVSATDPLTFVMVALILLAVAMGACVVPARRATKVDPMIALRHE